MGFKVSISEPTVKAVVKATFPRYTGRKVRVSPSDRPVSVTSYWSGGSRSEFVLLDLKTMRTAAVPQNGTPFDGGALRPEGVVPPPGFAIVEHVIFMGKDIGIDIHVHPSTVTPLLQEVQA